MAGSGDLALDRMALDDEGANPERLAAAIHRQLALNGDRVPVHEIALALDIKEIREERLHSFEGMLLTDATRSRGAVLLNAASSAQRRRFTLAHELLHFLNPRHESTAEGGFSCSRADMTVSTSGSGAWTRHQRQEAEANRFAVALLMPEERLALHLARSPDLEAVLAIADSFDVSKAAAARRYVALHEEPLAVLFAKNGVLQYFDRGSTHPYLALTPGAPLPRDATSRAGHLDWDELDPEQWLSQRIEGQLFAQTINQRDGWTMTLLSFDPGAGEEDD